MIGSFVDGAMRRFNEATKWSNISRVASSPLAKLTIAAPFVAFLVLLNEPVQDFLRLTPYGQDSTYPDSLSEKRLEIFYLGLIITGAGAGFFAILAPQQVVSTRHYNDFITFKQKTRTSSEVIGSLQETINDFKLRTAPEERSLRSKSSSVRFPYNEFRKPSFRLVTWEIEKLGNVEVDKVVDDVVDRLHPEGPGEDEKNLRKPFYDGLYFHCSRDVFQLEYRRAD